MVFEKYLPKMIECWKVRKKQVYGICDEIIVNEKARVIPKVLLFMYINFLDKIISLMTL